MSKIIRLTESKLIKLIKQVILEGGHWDGQGHWIEDTPANTKSNVKIDSGFNKFPCVKSLTGYDLNRDGSVDTYTPALAQTGESKQYYADGSMVFIKANGTKTKSTYSCQGNKIIDAFTKSQSFKTYKGNTPFINEGGNTIIPLNTKDSSGQSIIRNLQEKLMKMGFLKISRSTGNYGRMTQSAILLAAKNLNPGDETNQSRGINKKLYDLIMGQSSSSSQPKSQENWA